MVFGPNLVRQSQLFVLGKLKMRYGENRTETRKGDTQISTGNGGFRFFAKKRYQQVRHSLICGIFLSTHYFYMRPIIC